MWDKFVNLVMETEMIYKQNKNNKEKEYKNYNKCYTKGYNRPLNFQKILEKEMSKK